MTLGSAIVILGVIWFCMVSPGFRIVVVVAIGITAIGVIQILDKRDAKPVFAPAAAIEPLDNPQQDLSAMS